MGRRGIGAALAAATLTATLAALSTSAAVGPARAQSVSTDYASAPAGTYALDKAHTSVTLKVSHMGLSGYTFRMKDVSGTLDFDPQRPEGSKLQVQIAANSVDTGDAALDRQIATDVLAAPADPDIRFVSTSLKPGPEGRGVVTGDLTLHGQTRPVDLDVVFNGFTTDAKTHRTILGFSGHATVARSQFGAGAYEPAVGDDVGVAIEAEFVRTP